jgi:[acyl-carrier-protein] S-malonyltransferase
MGKTFFENFAEAKAVSQEADDLLHQSLSKLIFWGPEADLVQTKNAQTAIFVTSLALLRVLQKELPILTPKAAAGLSLGEYTALVAAEKIAFPEALLLVRRRGELMQEAAQKHPGTMAAVLGLKAGDVEDLLRPIQENEQVYPANFNTPGQVVISGTFSGIEKASRLLKEAGAKKIVLLPVSGAFHSGLMEEAGKALLPDLEKLVFLDSAIKLIMNVPGAFVEDKAEIKSNLAQQVTQPVCWQKGIEALDRFGTTFFLEIGPGKTLTAMNRKIAPAGQSFSLENLDDLKKLQQEVV